jgi:probable HAF family extracellular repeat protein
MSRITFSVWAVMALILAPLAGAQSYSITDLGVLAGGNYTQPTGLNRHGAVVGSANSANSATHAFLWTSATGLRDLGTLGSAAVDSSANGINNSNQVVGYSFLNSSGTALAFLWTSGAGMKSLGTLGGNSSTAMAINDAGQVVGWSYTTKNSSTSHPFLWTAAGGMQDLGTLGGKYAEALAINNSGAVVGYSYLADETTSHAFLWTPAGGMQDLGALGGNNSVAYAINDKNQVVGYADAPSGYETAFIWNGSRGMQSLGAGPGSNAGGINESGEVVGGFGSLPPGALLWTATQHAQALDSLIPPNSGWTLNYASAINQSGQIIVFGLIGNQQHGALLTPQTKSPAD